ncbi:uncharacterized protein LOC107035452 isoform X1 [Diachasma alloeum]|uniref:uncharacterized protein LOC107035452 isoform X1 n=1 Tax=Diachasma alloeum TaxID=454923 RepID=UPI000738430D|nr:uncharacterized protein LOC107035452 isoform X1 [Diachasma alloeum]XP_015108338.1 uncharacterized protein LOC107035452 isoform X1 [Diachasma alloeum]XP_015108339.1 uncharacterized protein LOC107035452 isoform X1 [Diachasma alloeum]XP_015108340.1 uncharacterized protein LOC107035452 isoform X1 [Diachasma alloeum]
MRRTGHETIVIVCLIIVTVTVGTEGCDEGWEKIEGVKPETFTAVKTLYVGENSQGIVTICFDRCLNSTNCMSFLIDFDRSVCASIESLSDDFEPAENFTLYQKICLKVPPACSANRLWQVERTLGAVLIDTRYLSPPEVFSRSQCYQKCIDAAPNCKSAQFRTSHPLAVGDSEGLCTLLTIERSVRPQSYRASMYRDEYLEPQCHNLSSYDFCSYAEIKNQTLPYADLKIQGLGAKQCEARCNASRDGFICRAFTLANSTGHGENSSTCLLHSHDTISTGVSALVKRAHVIYKEREPCLNLKVSCTNESLVIELETQEPFTGRLYASGYSETCDVQGIGKNKTVLTLKIPDEKELDRGNVNCGITPAYAVESDNQTRAAIWVTLVVQFNPIIQRLGDQSVRVGCTLDSGEIPLPRNVTVETGYGFSSPDAGVPPLTATIFNTTSPPILTMKIVDESMNEISFADLGQRLVLRIEIYPPGGPYDITARHLVASSASGDQSILLLDEIGCPVDPQVFPAMIKDPSDNKSLISTFTAFKFPRSSRVRFNAVVKFCINECEPTKCRNSVVSYGRRRRSVNDVIPLESPEDPAPEELPLDASIIVRDASIAAVPLRSGNKPDTVLIAGDQSQDRLLCVEAALALGLLILWLIVQILLTISCIYVIRRYRRLARKAEEDRADVLARHLYGIHGGNFEIARRVRWADHNGSSIS